MPICHNYTFSSVVEVVATVNVDQGVAELWHHQVGPKDVFIYILKSGKAVIKMATLTFYPDEIPSIPLGTIDGRHFSYRHSPRTLQA